MNTSNPYRLFKTLTDYSEIELKYANIFTRTVSMLTDIAFALLLCIPLIIHAMNYFVAKVQQGNLLLPFYNFWFAPISVVIVLFVWIVCAVLESSLFRGTPGKWMTGCAVVTGLGGQITFLKALSRQVIKFNFILLVAVFPFVQVDIFYKLMTYVTAPMILVNVYLIFFHTEKQAFHDIVSTTYVIHKWGWKSNLAAVVMLIASSYGSYQTVMWIKDHVVLEAVSAIPEESRKAIVNSLVKGDKNLLVDVGHHQSLSSPRQTQKPRQASANQAFEFVDDNIYKDSLAQDVRSVVFADSSKKLLNVRGPVYTTMEYVGSYMYEFQTYIPHVPNLSINPGAFNLIIQGAYDRNGSMLTPRVEDQISIEEKNQENIQYILVKKKVLFAQASPVEKIDGAVSLRLPIDLKSESVASSGATREVKMGAQSFLITAMDERSIDFEHHGPSEYFLGIVAYEKNSLKPIGGTVTVNRDQPLRTIYSYKFEQSMAKYEFNTAVYFNFESFPFSTDGQK